MNDGKGTETICPTCGKTFKRKVKGQTYCDRKCSAMGRYADKTKVFKKERCCRICGTELAGKKYRRTYCSDKCAGIGEAQMQRERLSYRKYSFVCPKCGRIFQATTKDRKYCSTACKHEGWKEEMRQRAEKKQVSEENRGETVLLVVKRQPAVTKEFMPRLGTVYAGVRMGSDVFVVPGFGKYGLILRPDEVKVVKG